MAKVPVSHCYILNVKLSRDSISEQWSCYGRFPIWLLLVWFWNHIFTCRHWLLLYSAPEVEHSIFGCGFFRFRFFWTLWPSFWVTYTFVQVCVMMSIQPAWGYLWHPLWPWGFLKLWTRGLVDFAWSPWNFTCFCHFQCRGLTGVLKNVTTASCIFTATCFMITSIFVLLLHSWTKCFPGSLNFWLYEGR